MLLPTLAIHDTVTFSNGIGEWSWFVQRQCTFDEIHVNDAWRVTVQVFKQIVDLAVTFRALCRLLQLQHNFDEFTRIHRVKWHHRNPWPQYNLYAVGQHGVLCQVKWWRFGTLFESVGFKNVRIITILLRKWCHNNKHFSELATHHGRKTAGIDMVGPTKKSHHCHPMYNVKYIYSTHIKQPFFYVSLDAGCACSEAESLGRGLYRKQAIQSPQPTTPKHSTELTAWPQSG